MDRTNPALCVLDNLAGVRAALADEAAPDAACAEDRLNAALAAAEPLERRTRALRLIRSYSDAAENLAKSGDWERAATNHRLALAEIKRL